MQKGFFALKESIKEGDKVITLSNVQKVYQSKTKTITAVDDVSLHVHDSEIFGIIGYSGAGKSTLIRLLNGLEKPTSGLVHVAGRDITNIKGYELRKARQEISMIFQHFNLLWSRTVQDNIAFPLEIAGISKRERARRVNELIQLVGLEGREKSYPSQLSGGQKQRVGIARALANNPKVLLCDEATSALDPQTTDSILDLLVDINKRLGLTIVLITHEMHVIQKICHRVAVMDDGKVVEEGSVLDVFKNPQMQITKRFVKQTTDPEETKIPMAHLLRQYPDGIMLQLKFIGESTEQPIITKLIRKFDININILQGNISQTRGGSYGSLIVQAQGESQQIEKGISFLKENHVDVEVIDHES